jgi:hypothetical protein
VTEFVVEYFDPWFRPTRRAAEWLVRVTTAASAYREKQLSMPTGASPQPCFVHEREVLAMPAWSSGNAIHISDAERSCFLTMRPGQVEVIADARTRRWRFTLLWVLQEIVATRLRQTHIDVHSACVESAGRGLLIAGPKGAGKTTLSLYLMRSSRCRSIANDRSFVGGDVPRVFGMPTAIKIRSPTLAQFPELRRGLPPVARPYLYTHLELETAAPSEEPVGSVDFALTPNQLAQRLGAATRASAPLGAIVFPKVDGEKATWDVEPIQVADIAEEIHANLYGAATRDRPTTFFEQLGGGHWHTSPQLVAAVAACVPAYRVRLGRAAYADRTLSDHLLELVAA